MVLDISKVGTQTPELLHHYDWRDCVRYALSVGATADELDFLYEGRGPRVLPGYAAIAGTDVFRALRDVAGGNPEGIVHGAQKITWHKLIKPQGMLRTVGKVAGIYDLKRMAVMHISSQSWDEEQDLVFETFWSLIYRFDGGFGGNPPPRESRVRPPEREPDFCVEESTSRQQALLYRLNGDFNPLHADPELAASVGFERPILHGLCTFGFLGRIVMNELGASNPASLRSLSGQFRRPVFPGDTLICRGWVDQERVIVDVATAEKPNEPVISNAFAELNR